MKRLLLAAIVLAMPAAAQAALGPARSVDRTAVKPAKELRVADYYKGKKHCRTVGSATVCN